MRQEPHGAAGARRRFTAAFDGGGGGQIVQPPAPPAAAALNAILLGKDPGPYQAKSPQGRTYAVA